MEKSIKPDNLFIARKRGLTAFAAAVFIVLGLFFGIAGPIGLYKVPLEDNYVLILLAIAFALIALDLLLAGALNIRNLFFPCLLTADEKGIYSYSGLFHYGFISWNDIEQISKDATWLDILDNEAPNIRIVIKDFKAYRRSLSFGKKWILFWSFGTVKIFTLCSQIKKKELCALLEERLNFYSPADAAAIDDTTVTQ